GESIARTYDSEPRFTRSNLNAELPYTDTVSERKSSRDRFARDTRFLCPPRQTLDATADQLRREPLGPIIVSRSPRRLALHRELDGRRHVTFGQAYDLIHIDERIDAAEVVDIPPRQSQNLRTSRNQPVFVAIQRRLDQELARTYDDAPRIT